MEKHPCPEERASCLSRLLFSWFDGLIWKGYHQTLTSDDLWSPNRGESSKEFAARFKQHWKARKGSKKGKSPGIIPVLSRTFWTSLLLGGLLKFCQDCLLFIPPVMLKWLVQFSEVDEEMWKGYLLAGLFFITSVLQTLFLAHYFQTMFLIGMGCRSALVSAIYDKAMLVSNSARKESTVGEIVNLMSVDASNIQEMMPYINLLWSAPLQILIALYFLWTLLGWSVLSGFALLLLLVPLNAWISSIVKRSQIREMKDKDRRVKLMNEILSGIKVLKLYAWESSFQNEILGIRKKEMKVLKHTAYVDSLVAFILQCSPFLVALVTSATYVWADENNVFDASKAFVSLTLFNIIKAPLSMLPMVISNLVKAQVSIQRLNRFLNSEEIDQTSVTHLPSVEYPIVIQNATFSWEKELMTLRNISMHVKEGQLVALVGPVGAGKSSILAAMLGELTKNTGHVNMKGSVAYVAQQAWIQCASLQDNVLFGRPKDGAKYKQVIAACALGPDLAILPSGDRTQIGERGINLSGGQKQRVSLARAAYCNADVYLLDDPLSAVDSHVGKHIFENLIGPNGLLKGKTRVLVTHGLGYLPFVDEIIVVKDGEISEAGTYVELVARKGDFADFLLQHDTTTTERNSDDKVYADSDENLIISLIDPEEPKPRIRNSSGKSLARRRSSVISAHLPFVMLDGDHVVSDILEDEVSPSTSLVNLETSEIGSVKLGVYMHYMKFVGFALVLATIFLQILSQAFGILSNIWLAEWSSEPVVNGTQDSSKRGMYVGIYAGLGLGRSIFLILGSTSLALGMSKASDELHSQMLTRIMHAPMWFFDSTPIGRIVNRFGKDVDTCDSVLPTNFRDFIFCFFNILATLIVICYSIPIFISVIVPVGVMYFFVQRFYVSTSRQLKRMESVSRSPIFSHFSETITGVATIRAFGAQAQFTTAFEGQLDENQSAYYPFVVANRWLAIRLEMIANLVIFFVALFAVLEGQNMSPGFVGLAVSYALQVTGTLNWVVRMTAALETNIVAVERIKEYSEVAQEPEREYVETKVNETWPEEGVINIEHYQTKYRTGVELVLSDITCKISSGEKVGIVGRTGSGKSSLTLALFRIIEGTGGAISIDGKDISKLNLQDLRSRLTIIPQDPVLFSGTLRLNLDPFHRSDEVSLWKVLESANLKHFVKGLPGGLQYEVSEGGENFSVGQRQQICLARALLRKTRILILDEATASVDLETDDLIQKTVRREFADATVLTIAHRLNTIMDSNRVMVLDKGKITEFDTPSALLGNKESVFYQMAKDAGLA